MNRTTLALAIAAASGALNMSDDIDPELLYQGIEEEEEEEDDDEDGDDLDLDEDDGSDDRGDNLDPDLPADDDLDEDDDEEEEGDEEEESALSDEDAALLAELAGDPKKSGMVPHSRFNEVNNALKSERAERLRLEEELARSRGQAKPVEEVKPEPAPAAFDFDDAEDRYAEALLEGDKALAKAIRTEIRTEERKQYAIEAQQTVREQTQQERDEAAAAQQKADIGAAVNAAYAKYPVLDPSNDAHDSEALLDVVAHRDLLISRGTPPAKAIAQAVERIGSRLEPAAKPKPGKLEMTRDQLDRNLDREKQIPARTGGIGERSKAIDYASLTDDEYDKLSDDERRAARGDFVSKKN